MPSTKQHKNKTKKFSCPRDPKHSKCNGKWTEVQKTSPEDGVKWTVKWAPCQNDEAVAYMKKRHGHTFNPHSRNENDSKPKQKYSKNKYPTKNNGSSAPSSSRDYIVAAQERRLHQKMQMGAPTREQNQYQQMPPHTTSFQQGIVPPQNMVPAPDPMMSSPRGADPGGHEQKHRRHKSHHHAREAEQEPYPSTAIPPPRMMPENLASPTGLAAPPGMPSAQGPRGEQQQRRHQVPTNPSSHAQGPQPSASTSPGASMPSPAVPPAPAEPDGRQRRRHRGRSSPHQDPQPSATMSPPEAPNQAVAVDPAPVAYPPQVPAGGQRPRRRHNKSSRQPEVEVGQAPQPPAAMTPPPGSTRESMTSLAEGRTPGPRPRGPYGYGDVHAAGPSKMSPMVNPMMTARSAGEDIPLSPAAQPRPGMCRARGAPESQSMSSRSSRRAPPRAGPATPPEPRMEPPPMSMPPFPGTGPGSPVPFGPSMSPPPSAPTPPVPDGAMD